MKRIEKLIQTEDIFQGNRKYLRSSGVYDLMRNQNIKDESEVFSVYNRWANAYNRWTNYLFEADISYKSYFKEKDQDQFDWQKIEDLIAKKDNKLDEQIVSEYADKQLVLDAYSVITASFVSLIRKDYGDLIDEKVAQLS